MQTMHQYPGLASEANLSGYDSPTTPPYTPALNKRPFERSDSPAPSIHPAETTSPAKKQQKRAVPGTVVVSELEEGDPGYQTDLDIVYPDELEEAPSASDVDPEDDSSTDLESDAEATFDISNRMQRLDCADHRMSKDEEDMHNARIERRASKRRDSRIYKRTHSQTLKEGIVAAPTLSDVDTDAMDDQDINGEIRRLRRRTQGPDGLKEIFERVGSGSEMDTSVDSTEEHRRILERRRQGGRQDAWAALHGYGSEDMVVD